MKTRLLLAGALVASLLSLAFTYAGGQPPAEDVEAITNAIRAQKESYIGAFNKGDLQGVLAVWAPNGEYVDAEGNVSQGRAAVTERYQNALAEMKGWNARIEGTSLRVLRPDLVAVDGYVELTSPDGERELGSYASLWTKQDGRWLVTSVRDLGSLDLSPAVDGEAMVAELEWMIGDWVHADPAGSVKLSVKRDLDRFLLLEYTIPQPSGTAMQVKQYVGFDPQEETLRSFVLDSTGGIGHSTWSKRGKTWRSLTTGILPDGSEGSSVNSIRMIDKDAFLWRSEDREVDGRFLPDVEVKFTRVAAN